MHAPHMASEPAVHLLVPFASASDPACQAALPTLSLPHLGALLGRLQPVHTDAGSEHSLSAPHERAWAQAIGLVRADGSAWPDGRLPWAAAQSNTPELPQGWFTPCHFQVGMEQVTLLPAEQFGLTDEHARPLFDALAPYCAEDGIDLHYESAARWHARGEVLRGIACASLDRVGGRSVQAWMTDSSANPAGGQLLKRLQSEAQMLFYTHPAHDAREALRLHPVNGFWLSGAGALDHPARLQTPPVMPDALRSAALQADWARWKDAWNDIDSTEVLDLLQRVRRGEQVTLTLCGERTAQRFSNPQRGARARIGRLFNNLLGTAPAWKTLESL